MGKNNRKGKVVSFEIKPRLLDRFNEICEEKGFSKSELMRSLINDYIEKNSKELIDKP